MSFSYRFRQTDAPQQILRQQSPDQSFSLEPQPQTISDTQAKAAKLAKDLFLQISEQTQLDHNFRRKSIYPCLINMHKALQSFSSFGNLKACFSAESFSGVCYPASVRDTFTEAIKSDLPDQECWPIQSTLECLKMDKEQRSHRFDNYHSFITLLEDIIAFLQENFSELAI